jgi:ABC-type branched-subunit amino acid transport system substrate-binding protein
VFFDNLNASGGIDGKYKVKLIVKDNKYGSGDNTATATAYAQTKGQVAAFLQVLGTDPVHSILSNLADDNIIAGPATLDSEWYENPNLFPILAPYQVQAANGLWYYLNKMDGKGKKVCTMTSNDGYGKAGLEGAKFAADKLGIKLTDNETFSSALSGGSYDAQVQTLQQKGCDAVWLVSLPTDTIGIFNASISKKFAPQWIGTSPTWINLLAQGGTADYAKDHYVVVAQGPEWGDTSTKGMTDMLAAVKKYAPDEPPNFYFAFGYMQAQAMSQILAKAAKDGDFSHAGIKKGMDTVGTLTFDGAVADEPYGTPEQRKPQRESTIFKVTPDTLKTNGGLSLYADDSMNFTSDVAKEVPLK